MCRTLLLCAVLVLLPLGGPAARTGAAPALPAATAAPSGAAPGLTEPTPDPTGVRPDRVAGRAHPPVDGPVVRDFDPPVTPYGAGHRGVDLAAAPGEEVRAALPGMVSFSGLVARRGWVTIDHGGGLRTTYGWLDPPLVTAGEHVRAGQVVGLLDADRSHLDWGARLDGTYIDPLLLLGRWEAHLVPLEASEERW